MKLLALSLIILFVTISCKSMDVKEERPEFKSNGRLVECDKRNVITELKESANNILLNIDTKPVNVYLN